MKKTTTSSKVLERNLKTKLTNFFSKKSNKIGVIAGLFAALAVLLMVGMPDNMSQGLFGNVMNLNNIGGYGYGYGYSLDQAPRIAFWPGKVNQHFDVETQSWQTDPDGVSGGHHYTRYPNDYGGRELDYCKKFYPDTISVQSYKKETITTWKHRGNGGSYTSKKMSYLCLQPVDYPQNLIEAYEYAYDIGMTSASFIEQADVYGKLNRITLAKIMSTFAIEVADRTLDESIECSFSDVSEELDEAYDNAVTKACQLGILGLGTDNFNPYNIVNRAQFAVMLSRILWGDTYNSTSGNYYELHLKALRDAGIISNTSDPLAEEVRGYVWLMLKRIDDNYFSDDDVCADPMVQLSCALGLDDCPEECMEHPAGGKFAYYEVDRVTPKRPRIDEWISVSLEAVDVNQEHVDSDEDIELYVQRYDEEENEWKYASPEDYVLKMTDVEGDSEIDLDNVLRFHDSVNNNGLYRLVIEAENDSKTIVQFRPIEALNTEYKYDYEEPTTNELERFDIDTDEQEPEEDEWVDVVVLALDEADDIIDDYYNDVIMYIEVDGDEADEDEFEIEFEWPNEGIDENDIDHNGAFEDLEFNDGELEFEIMFRKEAEYTITIKDGNVESSIDFEVGEGVDNNICGNGDINTGEQCDDANNTDGDGCSSICQWETKTVACTDNVANSSYNVVNTITQTCNETDGTSCTSWLPDNTSLYDEDSSTTECRFVCDDGFYWGGDSCVEKIIDYVSPNEDLTEDIKQKEVEKIKDYARPIEEERPSIESMLKSLFK